MALILTPGIELKTHIEVNTLIATRLLTKESKIHTGEKIGLSANGAS